MTRSKSSKRWLQRHHQDAFVLQAREQGLRSRAVYKLRAIQRQDRVLKQGQSVLDLGAAPGGWSEYARVQVGDRGRVIAVDLLPMEPIAGVEFVQGDFTEAPVLQQLNDLIGQSSLDLVLSDMAPNLSGMPSVDQPKAAYLVELAFELSRDLLTPEGIFVTKMFQGAGFESLITIFRSTFKTVKVRKPEASRARSREIYAVCCGLK